MVSGRIRLRRSDVLGIFRVEVMQTMSMSRCSSMVLTVKGRGGIWTKGGHRLAADADERSVAAARAFAMEGMDGAPLNAAMCPDEAAFGEGAVWMAT